MNIAPGRVLVVDDEPHVRELLREVLITLGNEVLTASNGAQALETVQTFRPDVILVDMVMPGLSGTQVLDALRRAGVAVPVVLISGHEVALTAQVGFFAVLHKPFDLGRLGEIVRRAIGGGRAENG